MTIKDLKEKIAGLPDDMLVMIPVNPSDAFDGLLFTPCIEESEVIEMGLDDIPEEDIAEMELLNKLSPKKVLLCSFLADILIEYMTLP